MSWSCLKYRHRLSANQVQAKALAKDETDYELLEVFKKYDINYFFYNGTNDSMDTCNKVSKYLKAAGYECKSAYPRP